MMNFKEFSGNVLKEIRERADGEFEAAISSVVKNNGIELTGISATAKGSTTGPCIYLDSFYEEYQKEGMQFQEAVDEIHRLLTEHLADAEGFDLSGFLDWKAVKGSIRAELVNAGQNGGRLKAMPHRGFLDMAVIYYAVVSSSSEQNAGTVFIRNDHMEMWGQDEESLYRAAVHNMRSDGEPDFESMESVIRRILPESDGLCGESGLQTPIGMYVLTNRRRCYGASEILDRDTLRMIADRVGDGFIVLPSSVHEVIILGPQDEPGYGKLADMVREVNDTQVDGEEILSYHVYVYSREEEMLRIVV
ncbi:MAG: DUF5688 family protein [Lachnospiraceae bacterium]|nr:DUF5688 family protein [Lachnospiraceae bacterium]